MAVLDPRADGAHVFDLADLWRSLQPWWSARRWLPASRRRPDRSLLVDALVRVLCQEEGCNRIRVRLALSDHLDRGSVLAADLPALLRDLNRRMADLDTSLPPTLEIRFQVDPSRQLARGRVVILASHAAPRGDLRADPQRTVRGSAALPPPSERTALVEDEFDYADAVTVPATHRDTRWQLRHRGELLAVLEAGTPIELGRGTVSGGRHRRVALPADNRKLSRHHLTLASTGSEVRITRGASANPVAVGGEPLARGETATVTTSGVELSLAHGAFSLDIVRASETRRTP